MSAGAAQPHVCEFRFYEELNDYLPAERRKRSFTRVVTGTPSVKDAIEALGVPHTDIDLILVNGRSVRWDCKLRGGERIAVYPMFERFDITPLLRLRPKPLREPRFVADVHLGTLARYLRLLGFDTRYGNDLTDAELALLTAHGRRVLLTRDVGLLKRKSVVRGHWLRSRDPEEQLEEVVAALQLQRALRPFTRCMGCNGCLAPIVRLAVRGAVPDRVYRRFRAFVRCRRCRRIYWRGTHFQRLQRLVAKMRSVQAVPRSLCG
ncbi:MAG: Mut7-C RNAse domain-containing protein [Vicinamibacterales bacterium]